MYFLQCYTGYSTKVKERQFGHKSTRNIVLRTHPTEAILDDTIPILVLNNIPSMLAASVEQALIVQRRPGFFAHVINSNTPFQKLINGISSAQLRHFSAKVWFLLNTKITNKSMPL
jgi:hypothetical protein